MPCPTCDHSLHMVTDGVFHCPRCGTMLGGYADGSAAVPALVLRCRRLEAMHFLWLKSEWHSLGIAEAIHPPGERPT
jgi:hypothetical protein